MIKIPNKLGMILLAAAGSHGQSLVARNQNLARLSRLMASFPADRLPKRLMIGVGLSAQSQVPQAMSNNNDSGWLWYGACASSTVDLASWMVSFEDIMTMQTKMRGCLRNLLHLYTHRSLPSFPRIGNCLCHVIGDITLDDAPM